MKSYTHGLLTMAFLLVVNGLCEAPRAMSATAEALPSRSAGRLELVAFRVRDDVDAALNADAGWAAPENSPAALRYDTPFRFRIQVRAADSWPEGHLLRLQYRRRGGPWMPLGVAGFPYPRFATPVVSVVSTPAYAHGAETERLLGDPSIAWDDGAGLNGVAETPVWRAQGEALEWEWPLVVRRFADGARFSADGELFELRVVDGHGRALPGRPPARLTVSATAGHLGGTFVETPGRLGPYQSRSGHLYFFMEPTETDNRLMAVLSTDHGRSWREVDPEGRPVAGDLEGVASARIGDTVHLVHQVTREVFHHAFELDGAGPARWLINSQTIARPEEPPTQFADLVARRDGSLVALYAGPTRLFLQVRSPPGDWGLPKEIDASMGPELSGPVLATGPDDRVTMAYTGRDGRGFVRHLLPDGTLTPRRELSVSLGRNDAENGAILPLVVLPGSGTTVVLYREEDGLLRERRFTSGGDLSDPVIVSRLPVVTDAVDSEQVGADLVVNEGVLHLLFIEQDSRALYHVSSRQPGVWAEPRLLVDDIDASWVRGAVHRDAAGQAVYGFVYDAGSRGGAGANRYFALPLDSGP